MSVETTVYYIVFVMVCGSALNAEWVIEVPSLSAKVFRVFNCVLPSFADLPLNSQDVTNSFG